MICFISIPRAFRYTSGSTMIANGVDLVTAETELGHANATTNADIYANQVARRLPEAVHSRWAVYRYIMCHILPQLRGLGRS